jgi:hypothetical protein
LIDEEEMMRRECIGEETLMDYIEGRLSEKARSKIEQHLSGCDICLEELSVAGKMIRDHCLFDSTSAELDSVPEHVTRRAVESVKAFRDKSLPNKISEFTRSVLSKWQDSLSELLPFQTPAMATVRGSKTVIAEGLVVLRKSFSDLDAEIEIEKKGQDRASIRVMLSKDDSPAKLTRVALFKDGREVSSYPLKGSAALFEDVPFGHYVLAFTRNGAPIGEYPFEIKETRHGKK